MQMVDFITHFTVVVVAKQWSYSGTLAEQWNDGGTIGISQICVSLFQRSWFIVCLFWGDVFIEEVSVSKKISVGEKSYKYFTGYLHNDNKVKPLHIMLRTTSAYVKSYDGQTKWMYSLIEDDDLLEK